MLSRIPKSIKIRPLHSRVLRYIATQNVTNGVVVLRSLLNLVLWCNDHVGYGNLAYNMYESVRLLRVNVYYSPTSQLGSSSQEVIFDWNGGEAPDTRIVARGTITTPARISTSPPENSRAQWWMSSDSQSLNDRLFTIACPEGTVIDVSYTFAESQTISRVVGVSGVTTNGPYFPALDNSTVLGVPGSQFLTPDGLATVTMTAV